VPFASVIVIIDKSRGGEPATTKANTSIQARKIYNNNNKVK
jgi:hypothetical protein